MCHPAAAVDPCRSPADSEGVLVPRSVATAYGGQRVPDLGGTAQFAPLRAAESVEPEDAEAPPPASDPSHTILSTHCRGVVDECRRKCQQWPGAAFERGATTSYEHYLDDSARLESVTISGFVDRRA